MRNTTRLIFNGYLSHVAQLNGVAEAVHKFNVEPTVQQKLETAIQESNSMLQMINVIGVDDQSGESLLLDVNGPLASRTNTGGGNRRQPKDRQALTKDTYVCKLTEFDAAFAYQLLDQWAKFDDFQVRLTNAIAHRQGLDRIMVGFNGITAEVETDAATNPLGQDVNIGWLQKIRVGAPDRVIDEVVDASGQVTIGAAGDYKTLDGLVTDAKNLLAEQHKNAPDLVAIVSRNLMSSKLLKAVEKGAASNQEELAADEIVTKARLGGLPLYDAPYFPDGTVLVTSLNNLSIYWQEGGRRRHIKDEPEYNRVADYQSSNDAYVIEDLTKVALVENIVEV